MNNKVLKSLDLDEDKQCETNLVFLLNCYKSREESSHSIQEFYGKFLENRNKFQDFETLEKKITYFCEEFTFHDRVISLTEDEISKKYIASKANSLTKRQLLSKYVNNIFKINSSFINKLNHGNYDEEYLKVNEFIMINNLFHDNALSILKEDNLNIIKLISFIIKNSRNKFINEIKKLKNFFLSNQTKSYFETKFLNLNMISNENNNETKKISSSPILKKNKSKSLKKKHKNEKITKSLMDQAFKIDAFQFLDSVRRKYIVPHSLNLPMTSKKNGKLLSSQQLSNTLSKSNKKSQKNLHMSQVYNILQISEYKPSLYLKDNPNELITEKFDRIFSEMLKANNYTNQTLKKYHEDFMKHIEKRRINEKSTWSIKQETLETPEIPKSETKIIINDVKLSFKDKCSRRSISIKG